MLFGTDIKSDLNFDYKIDLKLKPTKKELKGYLKLAEREIKEWERFIKLIRKQMK